MGEGRARGAAGGNPGANSGDKLDAGKADAENQGGKSGAAGTGDAAGTGAGAAADAAGAAGASDAAGTAPKADAPNNATVKPADLAPDQFERDANGAIVYASDGVTPKRKRGRKPGGQSATASAAPKTKPAKTDAARGAVATEMLAAQFQILNTGIAFLTKFDDFALDNSEAMQMAEATNNVMAQFDYVPDPKIAAVLGLVTTTGMIYGPRLYLYRKWLAEKQAENRARRNALADEAAANAAASGGYGDFGGGNTGPINLGQFSG